MLVDSRRLYDSWMWVAQHPGQPVDLGPEPGGIALRARWLYLSDLKGGSSPCEVSFVQWSHEIDLESRIDVCVMQGVADSARRDSQMLLRIATHEVPRVEAMIGLGDAHRLQDEVPEAIDQYEKANELAARAGFAFGMLRAQTALLYMRRPGGSAQQMLRAAEACEVLANEVNDRVYLANVLVAKGEALATLRRDDDALEVLGEALGIFEGVRSPAGIASAGVRLADVLRRCEDGPAVLALEPRVRKALEQTGQLYESVDLCDNLAAAHTQAGDHAKALAECERGMRIAGGRYPKGVAHILISKGNALRKSGRNEEAIDPYLAAYEFFDGRSEGTMTAYCLGHLAMCAENLGDMSQAVELRLRAVLELEQVRGNRPDPKWQQEYRERFDDVYRGALLTMVRANDAESFAAVFESLWGKRLSGVAQGLSFADGQDPVLLAQLIAHNDALRRGGMPTDEDRATRLRRALGRTALGAGLPELFDEAAGPALAAAYQVTAPEEAQALLHGVSPDAALLLLCMVPGQQGSVAWLIRAPGQEPSVGVREISESARQALETFSGGWPRDIQSSAARPLAELLPEALDDLPDQTPIQLVPLEELWSMPWLAVPLRRGLLGHLHPLMLAPSLRLAQHGESPAVALPEADDVIAVIGPDVHHHNLAGLRNALSEESSVWQAIRSSEGRPAVVVVSHGHPTAGVGHYLQLGANTFLTPADMYSSRPPRSLALIACWGAHIPADNTGEPLAVATLSLARGARQVLTTIGEMGDSTLSAGVVNDVLYAARERDWAHSVRWSITRRGRTLSREPLIEWAALTTLGAW